MLKLTRLDIPKEANSPAVIDEMSFQSRSTTVVLLLGVLGPDRASATDDTN